MRGRKRERFIARKACDGKEILTPRLRLPTAGRFGVTDGRFSLGVVENGGEMAKKAHAADAQLLLQLYELRREAQRGGFREGGDDSRYSRKRLATAGSKLLGNGGLVFAARGVEGGIV